MYLTFKSEAERQNHPIAKLIPAALWHDEQLFNNGLSDKLIEFLTQPLDKLHHRSQYGFLYQGRVIALLCILLHLPDEPLDSIVTFAANKLDLKESDVFRCAAMLGHIDKLTLLTHDYGQEQVYELVKENNNYSEYSEFTAFIKAAENGQHNVLQWIAEHVSEEQLSEMIQFWGYKALRFSAMNGQIDTVQWLISKGFALQKDAVPHMFKKAFSYAGAGGHLDIIQWVAGQVSAEELSLIIQRKGDGVLRHAASEGRLDVLQWIAERVSVEELILMLQKKDFHNIAYRAFIDAASNGRLDVLQWIAKRVSPEELLLMIQSNDYKDNAYGAFRGAAHNGHLEVLQWIAGCVSPEELHLMIQSSDFQGNANSAFRDACRYGYLGIVQIISEYVSAEELLLMIQNKNYEVFHDAASKGHLDILQWLAERVSPEELHLMIQSNNYEIYREAIKYNKLDVLQWALEQTPAEEHNLIMDREEIKKSYREAFRLFAREGRLDVLQQISAKVSADELNAMIRAQTWSGAYEPFFDAASAGHLNVLQWLAEKAPEQLTAMIRSDNYAAFRRAASEGYLNILQWMLSDEICDIPEQRSWMVSSNNNQAFRIAHDQQRFELCNFLLHHATCFAYAEEHVHEYSNTVNPFITSYLASLHHQANEFSLANPNGVFDLDNAEAAKLCFYLIRNLIRRNDQRLGDEIRFLLDIPAVKALAHREVTPSQPNELLRLAFNNGNQQAAQMLLNIPAVRELVEQSNYYNEERQGRLNLRALAQNGESSMTALSEGEKKRLKAVIKHYNIPSENVSDLMNDLRNMLISRYRDNPAKITVAGQEVILPVDFAEFNALNLDDTTYQEALRAYYRHTDHTAWRYLSNPNPWMHPEAPYVNRNVDGAWSTFDEYQPLIVLLWLAAQDEASPPTDGYTLEGRITNFIKELALIGRAHNWDKSREGKKGQMEEYDDEIADKPSCFSGVKRRLFQSVQGHALLNILTMEKIDQELRDFVQEHFNTVLREGTVNKAVCIEAYEELIFNLNEQKVDEFRPFNLSESQKTEFLKKVNIKYGKQFSEEHSYTTYIHQQFSLSISPESRVQAR